MSIGSLSHDLPLVTIRSISVSTMDNNVYLITGKESGTQVLIDAAAGLRKIRRMLDESADDASERTRLTLVVTTHRHWDHIRALRDLVADTGVRTAAGAADVSAIEAQTGVRADLALNHGDTVDGEGFRLQVIGLAGHTPGSIALAYEPPSGPVHLFTGDSLFPGGPGRTIQPEDFKSLMDDLESRVFGVFGDDTVVHPGHGLPTTVGAERPHLGEWGARGW